jgi:hopanoid biosynthesis associated RND transporter like protein HpnN
MHSLQDSWTGRGLQKLADRLCDHPWSFCLPQFLLLLVCLAYTASSLRLSTDRNDLVSSQEGYRRDFLEMKREFGLSEVLVVVVESESRAKNTRFLEDLAARVADETNLLARVFFRGDLKLMGPKALLFLPEPTLEMLHRGLQSNRTLIRAFSRATNLEDQFRFVNRQFRRLRSTPGQLPTETPLNRALPALQRLVDLAAAGAQGSARLAAPDLAVLFGAEPGGRWHGDFPGLASRQVQVLIAEATSLQREAAAIARLRELVDRTRAEAPGINVGITGESVLRHDEMAQANHDTLVATGIALVLTATILLSAYRNARGPALVTLCLLVGLGNTLGFATLAVGRLNILSITLVPILIGLAIDFGVHLVSRYEEESRAGKSPRLAMRTALGFTGIGICTSALTTAAAFFTMMITDLPGIRQMGLIAGMGLLVSLVPMLTLLPVLVLRGADNRPVPRARRTPLPRRSPLSASLQCCSTRSRVAPSPLDPLARVELALLKRPWSVLAIGLAFTAFTFRQLPNVEFDFNLQHLQTRGLPAVEMERKLLRSGSQSVLSCSLVADSLPEAARLEERVRRLPSVAGVTSLVRSLTEDQERKLDHVRGIKQELHDLPLPVTHPSPVVLRGLGQTLFALESYIGRALAARRVDAHTEVQLLALRASLLRLRTLVARDQPTVAARLTDFQDHLFRELRETVEILRRQDDRGRLQWEDVPPFLRDRFRSATGRYRLEVHPRENVWQRDHQEAFVQQLRTLDPRVTGSPVQFYESTTRLKEGFQQAARFSLAIVALLVLLHFRRLDAMLLALLPVLLGCGWMLGLMAWLALPFNPVNIASLALVVGVGVTNGVHVLNRFAEETNAAVVARSTGKAVFVSALTTIAGFGSLMVARHQGIASLGAVMAIGTATCMIASLVFLPTILTLLDRLGWSLPAARRPTTDP